MTDLKSVCLYFAKDSLVLVTFHDRCLYQTSIYHRQQYGEKQGTITLCYRQFIIAWHSQESCFFALKLSDPGFDFHPDLGQVLQPHNFDFFKHSF